MSENRTARLRRLARARADSGGILARQESAVGGAVEQAGSSSVEAECCHAECRLPEKMALIRLASHASGEAGLQQPSWAEAASEVGDLDAVIGVEEDVLRLDVAVRDAAGVAVGEHDGKLHEHATRGVLGEAAPRERGEPGEEVATRRELHDEVDLGVCGEDLVEEEHVGVAELAHGGDLAEHVRCHAHRAHDLGLVEHLRRHGLAAADGASKVDLGERVAAQQTAELVLAELALVLGSGS
jgi:hypothetical protein